MHGRKPEQPSIVKKEYGRAEVLELLAARRPGVPVSKRFKIVSDTTDFFRVDYDDVVVLGDTPYLIRNCEREGRFGLDDEPKYWVKRAVDLLSGEIRILKLVFHERFDARIGDIVFECFRSPKKEARILEIVRDHGNFMHGTSMRDEAGNIIRILEFISGRRFDQYIEQLAQKGHQYYFHHHFPSMYEVFFELVQAIQYLHHHGEKHGDIRRDHILVDRKTRKYRWIDFDFNYRHTENPFGYDIFGLGNILAFIVGGGDVTLQYLKAEKEDIYLKLAPRDCNIIFNNRIVNLKKVFPYIPESINNILKHFSMEAEVFYEETEELLEDMTDAMNDIAHL